MDPSWVWVVGVLFSKKSGIDARWILQHVLVFCCKSMSLSTQSNFHRDQKHDLKPPNGGLFSKGSPWLFQKNLGWWNKIIWPDQSRCFCGRLAVKCWNFRDFFFRWFEESFCHPIPHHFWGFLVCFGTIDPPKEGTFISWVCCDRCFESTFSFRWSAPELLYPKIEELTREGFYRFGGHTLVESSLNSSSCFLTRNKGN